jgi:hypothetical protein
MAALFDRFLGRGARRDRDEMDEGFAPPPGPGPSLSPAAPEAPGPPGAGGAAGNVAAKIAELLDLNAEPIEVAEAYAAFERMYPQASLPGDAQMRMAQLLAEHRFRLLAIEAFRKIATGDARNEESAEARLSLARLLGESPATFGEALSEIERLEAAECPSEHRSEARALKERIERVLEEIHPGGPDGLPAAAPGGPCAILAQTASKVPIPTIGALLAERLGLNRIEVNVALKRAPGILAREVPAPTAVEVAHAIQAAGTPVVVLSEERCPELPKAEIAQAVESDGSGRYALTLAGATLTLEPGDLAAAQFGYVRSRGFKTREQPARSDFVNYYVATRGRIRSPGRSIRHTSNLQALCDLHLLNPPRRIRLAQGKTVFRPVQAARTDAPRPTFVSHVKKILLNADRLALNRSLDLLFSDGDPHNVTYESAQAFDNHGQWLFLLACNGAASE